MRCTSGTLVATLRPSVQHRLRRLARRPLNRIASFAGDVFHQLQNY